MLRFLAVFGGWANICIMPKFFALSAFDSWEDLTICSRDDIMILIELEVLIVSRFIIVGCISPLLLSRTTLALVVSLACCGVDVGLQVLEYLVPSTRVEVQPKGELIAKMG